MLLCLPKTSNSPNKEMNGQKQGRSKDRQGEQAEHTNRRILGGERTKKKRTKEEGCQGQPSRHPVNHRAGRKVRYTLRYT